MTDQPTTPPAAVPADTDPVWCRLVVDCVAYQRAYPTPAHLAELIWQLADLAYTHGIRDAHLPPAERPPMTNPHILAGVMDWAARMYGHADVAAVHALAHAGQRERAARHARTETPAAGDETNGGNCGG